MVGLTGGRNIKKRFLTVLNKVLFSTLVVLSSAQLISAQDYNIDPETYVKTLTQSPTAYLSPYSSDMFDESIDLSTGALSFYTVDVALKGNSHLPVQVGRRFGDPGNNLEGKMVVDAPVLDGVAYCDNITPSPYEADWAANWKAHGLNLAVPNGALRRAVAIGGAYNVTISGATAVTKDNWQFECLTPSNYLHFLVHAPNGDKYYFDVEDGDFTTLDPYGNPWAQEVGEGRLYASRVEDKNGNWVKYEYTKDSGNNVIGLTRIHSNDGREITLSYLPGNNRLDTVTANGRVWDYQYLTGTRPIGGTSQYLHRVVQPDGEFWDYAYTYVLGQRSGYPSFNRLSKLKIKHPYGTEVEYLFEDTVNGIFKTSCAPQSQPSETKFFSNAVTQKKLKVGSNTHVWDYFYEEDTGTCNGAGISKTKWREVTSPVGVKQKLYFNREYNSKIKGKLVEESVYSAINQLINHRAYEYVSGPHVGTSGGGGWITEYNSLQSKVVTQQDGNTYTSEYVYDLDPTSIDYSYNFPIQTRTYSNNTLAQSTNPAERITDVSYEHNTAKWILGLTKKVTVNGRETVRYDYTANGQQEYTYRYGRALWHSRFAYNSDGTIGWVQDSNFNTTYAYDWKRGTPQHVKRADYVDIYQYVDDNGWLTSTIDGENQTTSYTRDNMGRLLTYTPPQYSPTNIVYDFTSSPITQTITQGPKTQTISYDSLLRPTLVDVGGQIYTKTDYNASGQKVFESFPSNNQYSAVGTSYTYDGLGRIKSSATSVGTTTHDYLSYHRHRVTDPSGKWTDTYAYGYDGPGGQDTRAIYEYANGAYLRHTYLYKDVWGEMSRLEQWGSINGYSVGKSQYFTYDDQHRLCRKSVPEGGDTVYSYDAAGRLASYEKGAFGSGCTTAATGNKVTLTKDPMGRVTYTDFYDANTPDITNTYDDNGRTKTVNRGGANWTYGYDLVGGLLSESLSIDSKTYALGYSYDPHGRMTGRSLPTGRQLSYALDALGRQTSVTEDGNMLASNISYHASGPAQALNFANGVNYSKTLNAMLQPDHVNFNVNGASVFDRHYTYNSRGLITGLTDGTDSSHNQAFTYDGLRQLTSASGKWGAGSYTYDSLGNIRLKTLGARNVHMSYNGQNRLASYTDSTGPNKSLSYDTRGNVSALGGLGFIYDGADQPRALTGSVSGTYLYDGNLKRVKSDIGGVKIYNVYDASGSLVHIDDQGTGVTTDYINGAGMGLARIKRSGTTDTPTYLHNDHLGSSSIGTDFFGGVQWNQRYTPFGEEWNPPAPANDNQAGFTGHIKDAATGLNYMQARYYDPVIGRFLSVDPVTFMDTGDPNFFNRYTYAFNDPINIIDPTGMAGCSDMEGQGLSGECFDASNFKESKADSSMNIVASAANDAAVSGAGANYAENGSENGFRVDGSNVSNAGTPVPAGKTSTVKFTRAEIDGADAFGHSHPEDVSASPPQRGALLRGPGTDGANPGPGDGAATIQAGMPNYITHQGRALVIEVSGGQARVRVVSGQVNRTERKKIRSRLRSMQGDIQ